MASPCELMVETPDPELATRLGEVVAAEAWRIEHKFSRYRDDNLIAAINRGEAVEVDAETADLFDFADQCHRLSDGLFDITSGVLRRIWRFGADAATEPPSAAAIAELMPLIGWQRVEWRRPRIRLPAGMEIDLGGIGKEYAVDRAFGLLGEQTDLPFLVNFGGDLRANRARADDAPWIAGIEHPEETRTAIESLALRRGALATSGDTRRSFVHEGVVYGHILHPLRGWPVRDAPRSITVAAGTCTEAGVLSTLAALHGADAEAFLDQQGVRYWSIR